MALSSQTRESLIPAPKPPSIDVKEEIRQVGFLLKQKGHYLIFKPSTSIMVDGWSNSLRPQAYAEAFTSCVQGSTYQLHKVALNRWKPAKTDVYVVQLPSIPPKLATLFEEVDQQFLYNGTDAAEALAIATDIIKQIAENIK